MIRSVMAVWGRRALATAALAAFLPAGCGRTPGPDRTAHPGGETAGIAAKTPEQFSTEGQVEEADIKAARAELSPEDQRLVEAQNFCPVMPDKRLGVMGTPVKVTIKDRPVFLCCKGCRRKALADPDKTLVKVGELKAKTTTP